MASGDSTPLVAAGNAAMAVNVHTARNVQVADRIVNIRSTTQGGSTGRVKRLAVQGSDSRPDTELPDGRPCRSNQTDLSPIIWIGHQNEMIVTDHYINVDYHLNTETVQKLQEADCNLESIQGALGQCLARLEWSSEAILQQKLTAFKLTLVDEKLPMLLRTVINHISNTTNMHQVIRLVQQAFREFGALLKAIKISSLTFIFQHAEDGKADELLESEEAQGRLITVLYQFLPEWVCVHARWEVQGCAWEDCGLPSTCDAEPLVTWRLPLLSSSLYAESHTKEAVDVANLTHIVEPVIRQSIERAVDRAVAPIHDAIDQMQRAVLRQEIAQDESSQQDLQQQLSDDKSEDPDSHSHLRLQELKPRGWMGESGIPDPMLSPQSQETELYKSTPHVTGLHYSQTSSITAAFAGGEVTRPTSMPPSFHPGGSPSFEPKDRTEHQTGSPAHRDFVLPSKSSDFLQVSVGLSEGYMSEASLAELRKDSEKIVNSRSHSLRGTGQEAAQEQEEPTAGQETSHKGREADTVAASVRRKASKIKEAEELLNWVNVKSKASQSKSPEIQRLMEQTALALQEEENASPITKAMDTVIVLDTSDSIAQNHLDELKAAAHAFVDGIEEHVEMMNLEENLAVVQMGGRAWVRQHLTNDYNRVREAIDAMRPDSQLMPTGGRTPLFQALVVCLGAIEDRGGVINVAGCHYVRPRLIIFTDGRPTDEAAEIGPDKQSNLQQVKYALAQLITEFSAKKHRTTPTPIFWVPIGANVDMVFLDSLARLGGGKVVSRDNMAELCGYFKVQQTIGCVYKLVLKNKDVFADEAKILHAIGALTGNLSEAETAYVLEEVLKKRTTETEDMYMKCDDYHNVFEDTERVNDGTLLPLGTRVVRGPHWKWQNQDEGGPGTVLQHDKTGHNVYVMWDTGQYNLYRYGHEGYYDIQQTQDFPRIVDTSTSLDIGVEVQRGADWKGGDEDDQGVGVVIRTHKRGKVKVRWDNGFIGSYMCGEDKREVEPLRSVRLGRAGEQPEEELGAVGGYDPAPDASRRVWQWSDDSCWQNYDERMQEKLQKAFAKRKSGSCIIERDGLQRRVIFKRNEERTIDTGAMVKVQSKVVSERQYQELLQEDTPPPIYSHPHEQESSRSPVSDIHWTSVYKRPSSSQIAHVLPSQGQDVTDLQTEESGKLTATLRKMEGDPSFLDQDLESSS